METTGQRLMLADQRPCTAEEVASFRDYHRRHSHVAAIVLSLTESPSMLTMGTVAGVAAIGRLKTFFGNIGSARCRDLHGSDRFLVMQATDVLLGGSFRTDREVLLMSSKVGAYKSLFSRADSDPKVTIVQSANDCLIADGNKTAIAAFLHAKDQHQLRFALPVYYFWAGQQVINWIL
jgi:hypothetical protein